MPRTWLIPADTVSFLEKRGQNSFMDHRMLLPGEIALFNENGLCYQYFTNCRKLVTHCAYLGEADELDPYFSKCITEVR